MTDRPAIHEPPAIHELHAHPASCLGGIDRARISIERTGPDALRLTWRVWGPSAASGGGLHLPAGTGIRRDGLWEDSCFELFLADGRGGGAYREFNFSPGGDWAAYRFDGYRAAMREEPVKSVPRIALARGSDGIELTVDLAMAELSACERAGVSMVLRGENGDRAWWALCHRSDQPDFHDPSCFIARLGPSGKP